LTETKEFRPNLINDYIRYLKDFERTGNLIRGRLYTYNYLFNKAPNFKNKEWETIKFYDWMPCTFVFDINSKAKSFTGINLHFLPVQSRKIWLSRLAKTNPSRNDRIPLKYDQLKLMMMKSKFGIRQYNMGRVQQLRVVPFEYYRDLFEFSAKTYLGVTLDWVSNRYRQYKPWNKGAGKQLLGY